VDAFRRQAEVLGQYLKKGRPVLIEGRLKLDQWEDKQTGQKRSRLGVVLESFQFIDGGMSRGDQHSETSPAPSSGDYNPAPRQQHSQPPSSTSDEPDGLPDDDDVPF